MVEILANTLSSPADAAIRTVVDFLFAVVVPKLADVTVVTCSHCPAFLAVLSSLLRRTAGHAKHVFRPGSVQVVAFCRIMAMSTCVPTFAFKALDFDIALVMLASKHRFSFGDFILLLFMLCALMGIRTVCGIGVSLTQVVWVLRIYVGG